MKHTSACKRVRSAFTLIELLVVISIIGILASLLLPALAGARVGSQKKAAKAEIMNLVGAINMYQTDYGRLPGGTKAITAAGVNDFTFGSITMTGNTNDGTAVLNTTNIIRNKLTTYQSANNEIMRILMAKNYDPNTNDVCNPRKTPYFHTQKVANSNQEWGVGPDDTFRDPWGNAYIITLDMNYDNTCDDAFYNSFKYGGTASHNISVSGNVMIWSFGPDKTVDPKAGPRLGSNKDNVCSWQ